MINTRLCLSLLMLTAGSANAVVYDEIKFAKECPNTMMPMPPADVADNMNFFRNSMGRWQITQIGNNHVIMGSGYGFKVKRGHAGNFYCVPKPHVPVTYNRITLNRECPPLSFPVPPEDVPANLNFFKNNMGRWQITQIGDKHVIMGSGYGFRVKKGTAGYFYCAHSSVIRDQKTMDAIEHDPQLFKDLLSRYNPLTMITSDGNTIPKVTLPLGVAKGQEFIIERQAAADIKVNYARRDIGFTYGTDTDVAKGKKLTFRYNGDFWEMKPGYIVKTQKDLSKIGKDETELNKLLEQHRSVEIRTFDGGWTPTINLSRHAPHGTMVTFIRNSTYSVRLNYSSTSIVPPRGTKTVFIKSGGSWFVLSDKLVRDNRTLRILGSNPNLVRQLINEFSSLTLQTSDGNWTRSFDVPKATSVGAIRNITLKRYSTWRVGLKFPGVTIYPRRGSITRFIAFDKWDMQGRKSIFRNDDVQAIATAAGVKQMLDKYASLSINISDDAYVPAIYLPDNATNGELVEITRRTYRKSLKVHYSGQTITTGLVEPLLFYFENNKWKIITLN